MHTWDKTLVVLVAVVISDLMKVNQQIDIKTNGNHHL